MDEEKHIVIINNHKNIDQHEWGKILSKTNHLNEV